MASMAAPMACNPCHLCAWCADDAIQLLSASRPVLVGRDAVLKKPITNAS